MNCGCLPGIVLGDSGRWKFDTRLRVCVQPGWHRLGAIFGVLISAAAGFVPTIKSFNKYKMVGDELGRFSRLRVRVFQNLRRYDDGPMTRHAGELE